MCLLNESMISLNACDDPVKRRYCYISILLTRMLKLRKDKPLGPNHTANKLAKVRLEPEAVKIPSSALLAILYGSVPRPQSMLGC